jgi:hypothetical protein
LEQRHQVIRFTFSTFTFVIPFSSQKQACGPEARALCAKSIGGKRNPLEGTPVFPQDGAGPSGAPTSESPGS